MNDASPIPNPYRVPGCALAFVSQEAADRWVARHNSRKSDSMARALRRKRAAEQAAMAHEIDRLRDENMRLRREASNTETPEN